MEQQSRGSRWSPRRSPLGYLAAHYVLYGVVNLTLLVVNLSTDASNLWFFWVVWGWGMAIAAHAGLVFGGFLGAHVAFSAVLNVGLVIINLVYSDYLWFYWPLSASIVLLAIHLFFAKGVVGRLIEWGFGEDGSEPGGAGPP